MFILSAEAVAHYWPVFAALMSVVIASISSYISYKLFQQGTNTHLSSLEIRVANLEAGGKERDTLLHKIEERIIEVTSYVKLLMKDKKLK